MLTAITSNGEVFVDQLRNLQCQKDQEIRNHINDFFITDITSRHGIVNFDVPLGGYLKKSNNFCLSLPSACFVNVGSISGSEYGGIAYNSLGERITVETANKAWIGGVDPSSPDTRYYATTPVECIDPYGYPLQQSSGNVCIPLKATAVGCLNTVWIDYLKVVCPSGQIVETEDVKSFLVEYGDGYTIYVIDATGCTPPYTPPVATAVYVGRVCVAAGPTYTADNDETNRHYIHQRGETVSARWPIATPQEITFQNHVCYIGTGTVATYNPHGMSLEDLGIGADQNAQLHQTYFHEKAIIHADPSLTCGSFYPECSGCEITICGFLGSPVDNRLSLYSNIYLADDAICHHYLNTSTACVTFGTDYTSGSFASPLCADGMYYFYVDNNNPTMPSLTFVKTTLPANELNIYPIFVVCWCSSTYAFTCGCDLRVFKNPETQYLWESTGAHVCHNCEGRFGYNRETCLFEGYDGASQWLPFHAGYIFVACETSGAVDCYSYAHGLGVTPDVVLVTLFSCGYVWEDVLQRTSTDLVICTGGTECFQVTAWKSNTTL